MFLGDSKKPLHLTYAIPDHPWIDSADAAAVRIAMTVAFPGNGGGLLERVIAEQLRKEGEIKVSLAGVRGEIAPNLQVGANVSSCHGLKANANLSNPGVKLHGSGFVVSPKEAETLLKDSVSDAPQIIWDYLNGKDLTNRPRGVKVIDAFPFTVEDLQNQHSGVYQHLLIHVKPERDHNSREGRKKFWWVFGEPNKKLRLQLAGLPRYIATVETSKHRFFNFLDAAILPDNMLTAIASDDAAFLGVCRTYNSIQNQHVESSALANTVYGSRFSRIPESNGFGAIYLLTWWLTTTT